MPLRHLKESRILIVDDEPANVLLLERLLERSPYYLWRSIGDPRQFSAAVREFQPDLIILDLHMPHRDGFELLGDLDNEYSADEFVPVLVLTADATQEAKLRALAAGARDFLHKPFDVAEAYARIDNLLETRFLHMKLRNERNVLEEMVAERIGELKELQVDTLRLLNRTVEYRDDMTGMHTSRVGANSALVAGELGLPEDFVALLRDAAPLHDIGKVAIPDSILLKPGKLTPEEWEVMKGHTTIGAQIFQGGHHPLRRMAADIALTHHERMDGKGYPRGLAGEDIPLAGRIVSVVDVFDALTHERPYKAAWTAERAVEEIERGTGTQFDPAVVDAFCRCVGKFADGG